MYRGSTTTIECPVKTNIDLKNAKQLWLSFGDENDEEIITKEKKDLIVEEKKIICKLSQQETLNLNIGNISNKPIFVQLRILRENGVDAIVSNKRPLYVKSIIKEGEIK